MTGIITSTQFPLLHFIAELMKISLTLRIVKVEVSTTIQHNVKCILMMYRTKFNIYNDLTKRLQLFRSKCKNYNCITFEGNYNFTYISGNMDKLSIYLCASTIA